MKNLAKSLIIIFICLSSLPLLAGSKRVIVKFKDVARTDEVYARLTATAIDLGTAGWDEYFGRGLIDLYAAITAP